MSSVGSGRAGVAERVLDTVADLVGAVIIALAFFFFLTPVAIAMRALGKDPLRLARDLEAKSYWRTRDTPLRSGDFETQR